MNKWYRLDSTAKVFPATTTNHNSNVFRISAIMRRNVNQSVLQQAANTIRTKFPNFFIRIRRGLFWNFFEFNPNSFKVYPETLYPTAKMSKEAFLIRVLFSERRISLECEHDVADGVSALNFFKALLYYYLKLLCVPLAIPSPELVNISGIGFESDEDSYMKYAHKIQDIIPITTDEPRSAYKIVGDPLIPFGHNVITGVLSASKVHIWAKKSHATITELIAALLIRAMIKSSDFTTQEKPIVLVLPVNLRSFFRSTTMRNFFATVSIVWHPNDGQTLSELIIGVKYQLQEKIQLNYLQRIIDKNVHLANNKLVRFLTLPSKTLFLRAGFQLVGDKSSTMTFSNLGIVKLPLDMQTEVQNFEFVSYPSQTNPIVCNLITFNNQLTVTFNRTILEPTVIKAFFSEMKAEVGSSLLVYSNDWGIQ